MSDLSQSTKDLISKYELWHKSLKPKEGASVIHVDEVASRVAAFYEQIRTIIDWKEEHLMRRAAIIRKIKRRFLDLELSDFAVENISEPLVLELIRGGYFPNDKIEESKIRDIQAIIEKYVFILKNNPEYKKGKAGMQFYTKLLEIAACEIEETLAPSAKEIALIDFMFSHMIIRIKVNEDVYKDNLLKKEDQNIQIYIGVQKALFKLDNPIISYNILRYKYPYWDNPSQEELLKISQNIHKILKSVEAQLEHPLQKRFYTICERYDTPYLLLGDILSADTTSKTIQEVYQPQLLENLIKNAYISRLENVKIKIKRAAIYSVTSIFVTKILSLIILELILARILNEELNLIILVADVLVPTLFMVFLVATVKLPSNKNISVAVMETMKIVYQREKQDTYELKVPKIKSVAVRSVLSLIYLVGAVVSFGLIYWIFNYFNFPISSIVINIIFIALILFAGKAIQRRAHELNIEEEREGFLGFISDVLLLPITELGRWMSNTWKQYNAIAAFFSALIDMPFSTFVEFIERWRYFIKERKEEIQ
ncbi:MAG: hypothetical protein AAB340_03575 [Patescibacteria group bacterium]